MNGGRVGPDFERMQAFVVALAESKALRRSQARPKLRAWGEASASKIAERASVAVATARAEQRRYASLFEALPVAVLLSDRRGRVRIMNTAARQLLGLGDARPASGPVHRLVDEASAAELAQLLEDLAGEPLTARVRARGGRVVELRAAAMGAKDVLWTLTAERPDREETLLRKLTDNDEVLAHQRRRIEALERESQTKDKFIAVLGHDLRGPLNAVLGWTQLMRREVLDTVGRERALEIIERNARSQASLIEELLDVSRMNEGKLALELTACDVGLLVRRAIEAALPEAARRGVDLSARIEATATEAPVAGDRTRLDQIFTNLVSNALKFTPSGGAVQVVVRRDAAQVCVEVRDTGKGIAPDDLPHVFKWLRQGDGPPTRDGLGLGLFIVRRLTELHGGSVEARSDGEGLGTTVTVRLPCSPPDFRAPLANSDLLPDLGEAGDLAGISVLVVDDEPDAVDLLARVLSTRGARVMSARDAASALALAVASPPDVVVTDLGLPDMDGGQLVGHLRAALGSTAGIVVLTGFGVNSGAACPDCDARLTKPVDIRALVRAIRASARRGAASASTSA